MELATVRAVLGLDPEADVLAPEWAASQATMPTGPLFFLDPPYIRSACRAAGLPAAVAAGAVRTARQVATQPALSALVWHGYYCTFRAPVFPAEAFRRWPAVPLLTEAGTAMLPLLILLGHLDELQATCRARGIPPSVQRATLADILLWMREHRAAYGHWGLRPSRLGWLRNHLRAEIFQLGRLQFQLGRFARGASIYRHRRRGVVVALSDDDLRYRADGQLDGAGGVTDPAGAWTARLQVTDDAVTGAPITPSGAALPHPVRLRRTDWQIALRPGDPVLHIHIPAGSPLDFSACGASLAMALAFFPRHFPERACLAFACSSWLLDAQLEDLLPPAANLVRFLREFYLLPRRSSGQDTLERVFGGVPADLRQAPRDTTLRRAILDHLLKGGHVRGARCFLFPEDLRWGDQVYRRQWPEVEAAWSETPAALPPDGP